jgi:hypothetical protein
MCVAELIGQLLFSDHESHLIRSFGKQDGQRGCQRHSLLKQVPKVRAAREIRHVRVQQNRHLPLIFRLRFANDQEGFSSGRLPMNRPGVIAGLVQSKIMQGRPVSTPRQRPVMTSHRQVVEENR